jgi:hypothetical protein
MEPLITLLIVSVLGVYTNNSDVPEVTVPPVRVAAPAVSNPPDASVNLSEPDMVKVVVPVILSEFTRVPPATSVAPEDIKMLSVARAVPEESRLVE